MTSTTTGGTTTVVASVPASHVYVRHLSPPDRDDGVRRIDDPSPARGASTEQSWWPPGMLDPRWIEQHDVDVFHIHFGFDALTPEQLGEVTAALRRRGTPLVLTVHDLRNPHHHDPTLHDQHLDVLVPAAEAVLTLTDGAAAEIRRRWGRDALVVPHPHVVPLDMMGLLGRRSRPRGGFRVGLHVKSVRASMDPMRILPPLVEAVRAIPGGVLQVNGHHELLDPSGPVHDPVLSDYLRGQAAAGRLDLRVHDFLPDDRLWGYLASLDASVLPYRFGTHSGWLEACRDVGATVIAPDCGYYADQGPVASYVHHDDVFDPDSLVEAVRTAYEHRRLGQVDAATRRAQRQQVADTHRELYRGLLG